jgi:alpha-L-fucosidase 2
LAALPKEWPKGSYRGLLARGAFEVLANWSNGHADRFEILSRVGGPLKLRYPAIAGATVRTSSGNRVMFKRVDNADISFDTKAGRTYVFTAIP